MRDTSFDAELKVDLQPDLKLIERIRSGLAVGALGLPAKGQVPLLSRIRVT